MTQYRLPAEAVNAAHWFAVGFQVTVLPVIVSSAAVNVFCKSTLYPPSNTLMPNVSSVLGTPAEPFGIVHRKVGIASPLAQALPTFPGMLICCGCGETLFSSKTAPRSIILLLSATCSAFQSCVSVCTLLSKMSRNKFL